MTLMVLVVLACICSFIPAIMSSGVLWKLECQPAVGIVGQTTIINCLIKYNGEIEVHGVFLKKQDKTVFAYKFKQPLGDSRFSLVNPEKDASLQISDTKFSDEGAYVYRVVTNRGEDRVKLSINVTARYKDPIISSWPGYVTDGGPVDLYCNATDGFPAGTIHWFDRPGNNWTVNSVLTKVNQDTSGLKSVALSSKLTFKSIDSSLAPFRCIILNSKFVQEGEKTFQITLKPDSSVEKVSSANNTTHIVAGVMVIGSLIVGLLFSLLIFRGRGNQRNAAEIYQEAGTVSNQSSDVKSPLAKGEEDTDPDVPFEY